MTPCAACGRGASFGGNLMCYGCWSRVPEHLQARVYKTRRDYKQDPTAAKRRAHRSATAAAVRAVTHA